MKRKLLFLSSAGILALGISSFSYSTKFFSKQSNISENVLTVLQYEKEFARRPFREIVANNDLYFSLLKYRDLLMREDIQRELNDYKINSYRPSFIESLPFGFGIFAIFGGLVGLLTSCANKKEESLVGKDEQHYLSSEVRYENKEEKIKNMVA